ncbi:hypothetical protein RIF29_15327 [Crotalaria pallida]|uniref:Uncharacterized protein n=1 Tax=Crotalaria pallida TaxID=3830 RepID=A0AAN9FIX1_CROPI
MHYYRQTHPTPSFAPLLSSLSLFSSSTHPRCYSFILAVSLHPSPNLSLSFIYIFHNIFFSLSYRVLSSSSY